MDLVALIKKYYDVRKLEWPDFNNSMKFVMTEIAEVYEIDLARSGNWIRNNPQNKPSFDKNDLAKELGDAIMMLIVAGLAEGVDPLQALEDKINKKMATASEYKQATLLSKITEIE